MNFRGKAKQIKQTILNDERDLNGSHFERLIEVALQEAHSLGVKQGREEQRKRDAEIVDSAIPMPSYEKNFPKGFVDVLSMLKKEILSAKGE